MTPGEKYLKERRKHHREACLIDVDYASNDRAYRDFIQNISDGGVFIATGRSFSVGQEVSLAFTTPHDRRHVKTRGKVVRSTLKGIGVKCNTRLSTLVIQSI